jgi:hypothetical protein
MAEAAAKEAAKEELASRKIDTSATCLAIVEYMNDNADAHNCQSDDTCRS